VIRAVISDFGGVLTTPLMQSFLAFQESSGIPLEALYGSMARIGERDGANPLYELETGRMTERDFLAALGGELSAALGRAVSMEGFGETYFRHLSPNTEMISLMRELRAAGYRMAICTNNVREWEPLWRPMLPVEEIFDVVVDSAYVGVRKPDPEIYAITLERLGCLGSEALFIDDIDVNCDAARAGGMQAVHFVDNDQAIPAIRRALGAGGAVSGLSARV
jgi:putative hydrolase of the HAD superfamily